MALLNHGRDGNALGIEKLLPLTQESGGGPTRASICENGEYWSGKLYVRGDGVLVFVTNEVAEAMLP